MDIRDNTQMVLESYLNILYAQFNIVQERWLYTKEIDRKKRLKRIDNAFVNCDNNVNCNE